MMNKKLALVTLMLAASPLAACTPISANHASVAYAANTNQPFLIKINGNFYYTPAGEPSPYLNADNRTMVPVRFISNALGVLDNQIEWDESSQTVTIHGNKTIKITIGEHKINVDGKDVQMDTSAEQTNYRTFIPARFIAEALGAKVTWDDPSQTVIIQTLTNAVSQSSFIKSLFDVLSHASTMGQYHFDYSYQGQRPDTALTAADGGGYTAEKVGITPSDPNGAVTADQAAKWLAQWAKPARNISMDVNVSSDPFTWAQINGWFEGTSVTGKNDPLFPADVQVMQDNLRSWLFGYKLMGHTVYLHFPMVPVEPMLWFTTKVPVDEFNGSKNIDQIMQTISNGIQKYNHAKITIENGTATYYEDPETTDRVFNGMGVPGNRAYIYNASRNGLTESYPVTMQIPQGSTFYILSMGPTNDKLLPYGAYAGFDYILSLDSSLSVNGVQIGTAHEDNGTIPSTDGNIITNYPKMAWLN